MIILPFVYFFSWFLIEYKKRRLDAYTFILLLYTLISLCSIMIDVFDFYAESCQKMPTLGIIAPFVYITLLTICIQPFSKFQTGFIQKISGYINERHFNLIVYFYFAVFLIVFFVSATRIQEIITSNALAEIRNEQYRGEAISFYDHLSGLPRYICAVCAVMGPSSFIMIPLLFLGVIKFKKKAFFSFMSICGSLTMLLIAINVVDRSNFIYWGLTFAFCYIIFRHNLPPKANRWFFIMASLFVGLMLLYLASVTISRFGEREDGTSGGIVVYAGQSYINFCNFFNYLVFDVSHKPEVVLLPNINHYILHGPTYFEYAEQLGNTYHHTVANFSTFIGLIMSVSGFICTVLYCFAYRIIAILALSRPNIREISIRKFIFSWAIALNVVLGLFGYYYMNPTVVMAAFIWWLIGLFLTKKFVWT